MNRFDKDVDIDEKIVELKLDMKNTNNLKLYKNTLLYLSIYKGLKIKILRKWNA